MTSLRAHVRDITNDTSDNLSDDEDEAVELIANFNFKLSKKEYLSEYTYSKDCFFEKLNARLIENQISSSKNNDNSNNNARLIEDQISLNENNDNSNSNAMTRRVESETI